jgi:N-acetyl-gamma-glutamyl-phosphate reductase
VGHTAAVLGASGYAGGEVVRLLLGHPEVEVAAASGGAHAGAPIASIHPQLAGATDLELLPLEHALGRGADVAFSCLPTGGLRERLADLQVGLVVDLSDDFRGPEHAGSWAYGLTEYARESLRGAGRIANPGCYPTAGLLALLPFARAGVMSSPVIIDALSGVSGAGRKPEDRLLFSGMTASAAAYGTTEHRHVPEIERGLADFGGTDAKVSFTPHLVPMARGLLVTARAPLACDLTDREAIGILADAYAGETFVLVTEQWPATKLVHGTNRALVSARVDARNALLIGSAAVDNLGKGAAGQAVQNANVALGLEESIGLGGLGVWP